MKPLLEEILDLEGERLRLEAWRARSRADAADTTPPSDPSGPPAAVCERCGSPACGGADYVVTSDAMTLRVGFRCAVEALLVREAFAGGRGAIAIGVAQ